jgi:hypothetical protein
MYIYIYIYIYPDKSGAIGGDLVFVINNKKTKNKKRKDFGKKNEQNSKMALSESIFDRYGINSERNKK